MDGLILVLSVGALLAMLGALVPGFGSDTRDGYGRSRDPGRTAPRKRPDRVFLRMDPGTGQCGDDRDNRGHVVSRVQPGSGRPLSRARSAANRASTSERNGQLR